jgi:DNA-binding IclR family transcriptional regulator
MKPIKSQKDPEILKVVAKTFRVMELLADAREGSGVTALARGIEQPKATVFRILATLSQLGYTKKDNSSNSYSLTPKIKRLVHGEMRETLCQAARPFMERLLSRFEQTVNLAMLEHDQVVYVDMLEGLRSIRMSATVDTYAPVHCTAIGKSIAAFLPPETTSQILRARPMTRLTPNTIQTLPALQKHLELVRSRGYAIDDEETEIGARCVAAPICGPTGLPFAALSVSGPTSHLRGQELNVIAKAVKQSTQRISAKLGFRAQA